MTHVQWDYNAMSPIVDGKIVDPQTGEIKPAGKPTCSGPPSVQATWHNLSIENQNAFRTIGMPTGPDLDRLVMRIAKHVQLGAYKLHSINGTQFAISIMCYSVATDQEFMTIYNTPDEDMTIPTLSFTAQKEASMSA